MKLNDLYKLALAVVVSEVAGVIGSIFTIPAISGWYATLTKPALNPPGWVFGPVWTLLYALMGLAAFWVWKKGWHKKEVKIALAFFAFQLLLNMLWSLAFFGLHSPLWAFVNIVFMWLAIVATMIAFWKISRPAFYLLVPYILWVSFAAYLNLAIILLN
jgi:tryptophan-rich sensory protein